ncbi:Outer membrane protein assembly factor BamB, contains PQQ-like beta-propeller repeat [Neorhodopirellula lusitana]|uniref:Outer membrane protein assembly factor BamB, contains PQQ-like beta-propeller repeat n=1 Tax=Neorhodopirellula lusitana TaxID=445327 RepID=A0ABY1Q7B2_9BACT|nr:PQQ-binding-like beta-propeller repeat protein [Neorhodopirellula lusitana]SMP61953.1 Outer membrane protein assembly factor BamB, contains PQQ-like beta-propeller repeat [Neorhodopirellula lusitana]
MSFAFARLVRGSTVKAIGVLSVVVASSATVSLGSLAHAETLTASSSASPSTTATWPQWRGPSQQGVAPETNLPTKWSESTAKRIEIPGRGSSTPVVVGNVAYLTSGIDGQNTLLAIDLDEAKTVWQIDLGSDRGNKHRKGSGSNPSPVTDGNYIAAYFRSGDLACVKPDGTKVWSVNLQEEFGEDTLWWDLGSSPLLVDSMVVIPVMQTGPSYLVAFDLATGKQLWKVDRTTEAPEEAAQSYSTPLAVNVNGTKMIAVMGADTLTLNQASDGKEVARLGGFNPEAQKYFRSIASPVADGNLILCPYSRGATVTAVDLAKLASGAGKDSILWHRDDLGSDVPTPTMRNGIAYFISDGKKNKGTVTAIKADSGKTLWEVSLPRTRQSYSSSPLLAGDKLYVTGEDAKTAVVGPLQTTKEPGSNAADQPTVLSVNEVDDNEAFTVASPTPAGNRLLLRTKGFLYIIE